MRIDKEPLSNSRPSWANVKGGARFGTFGVAVSSSSSWAMEFEKTIMGLERLERGLGNKLGLVSKLQLHCDLELHSIGW
jgi:hypothetical protein